MTLIKWTPKPKNDFDNMLDTIFYSDWKRPLNPSSDWNPKIDIKETDKLFLLKADIPGLNKKDIKLKISDDQLSISGERKEQIDNNNDYYHHRERSVGKFHRSFNLPESINKDKIHARFKNGILSIELEKQEEIAPKEKEIAIS